MKQYFTIFILSFGLLSLTGQTICTNLTFNTQESAATLPIEIGNEIANGPFTIEMWIDGASEDNQGQHPTLLSNRTNDQAGVSLLMHASWGTSANKIMCLNFEDVNYFETSCPLILDETCHYLVITRRDDVLSYYLDGDFIYKRNIPSQFSFKSSEPILLGGDRKNSSVTPYLGAIEELKFWKRTLSAAEISNTTYRELAEDPTDLIAHYRFIDDDSALLIDESSNEYHGLLGDDNQENKAERSENCCAPIVILSSDETETFDFSVFPVPASNQLNISLNEISTEVSYEIFNVLGTKCDEGKFSSKTKYVNIESLQSGQYFIKIQFNNESRIKAFSVCQ